MVGVLTNPLNIVFPSIFILFPLLKKYAKKLDKKELPRSWPTLARFIVGPTLAIKQAFLSVVGALTNTLRCPLFGV